MNDERKQQQIENNKMILAPISNDDANRGHIFRRMRQRVEAMRIVAVFLKRKRQSDQRAEANIEVYLDDWVYQHGTPIDYLPSKDHPRGGPIFQNAMADCVDRITKQQGAANHLKEDAAFREMQGPLAEGFDLQKPMGGLPGDADIEAELIKADPELKRFR